MATFYASKTPCRAAALSEQRQQMKLNSKLTWGLAWTGLAVVLAVPSADFLTGKMGGGTAALITSTTDPVTPAAGGAAKPVKTSTVTTTRTKTGGTITPAGSAPSSDTVAASAPTDPVNKLLKSGKPLPDYITGGTGTPQAPADAVQVAAVDPAATVAPPMPFPSWARPHDIAKTAQAKTLPVNTLPTKTPEPVVIVDDTEVGSIDAPDQTDGAPIPPAGLPTDPKVKRLDQYLQSQGLLNESSGRRSSASVTVIEEPSATYDPNGFYLSEGPNGEKARRAARRARLEQRFGADAVETTDDGSLSFNLF